MDLLFFYFVLYSISRLFGKIISTSFVPYRQVSIVKYFIEASHSSNSFGASYLYFLILETMWRARVRAFWFIY